MVLVCHKDIRNAEVLARTGHVDILSIIAQRRHGLFGRVRRLHYEVLARKALHGEMKCPVSHGFRMQQHQY